MSDFSDVCEAIADDLTGNIVELGDVTVHTPSPWDPEHLIDDGRKHLAVFPDAEDAESSELAVTGAQRLMGLYNVLYWEPAQLEGDRAKSDDEKARDILNLHNSVRARFARIEAFNLANSELVRYVGSSFPSRVASVRWFGLSVAVRRWQAFT